MSMFRWWFERFADRLITRHVNREPDFIVGGKEHPYLLRWYLNPWRSWHRQMRAQANPSLVWRVKGWLGLMLPSAYLHCFMRSDDDRALHDHPWLWCSILLRGSYVEWCRPEPGIGCPLPYIVRRFNAGSVRCHWPTFAHRLVIDRGATCWTLFITGPRVRTWGFLCPKGWVPWQEFTAADDPGSIGRGCGEP